MTHLDPKALEAVVDALRAGRMWISAAIEGAISERDEQVARADLERVNAAVKALTALAALPQAEPVADGWVLVPREPTEAMVDAARHFLEPSTERIGRAAWRAMLAASPSQPKAVKALEWRQVELVYGYNWLTVALSDATIGRYSIDKHDKGFVRAMFGNRRVGHFGDVSAAKAAAQSDYEARIRSALVSPSIKREA